MLSWAFRYLVVAVIVAASFAWLQDSDWWPQLVARTTAAKPDLSTPSEGRDRSAGAGGQWDELVVAADRRGHFFVEAMVNGTPIPFLVDTGASDVVLTMADARRLGFHPGNLNFSQGYQTANGEVRGAPISLRELRLGQFRVFELPASVNEGQLGISLLGIDFLRRLRGYEVVDGRLIMRW